jgi:2-(3-amino-3-carboxypropyl)histidine synthase
MKKLFIEAKYNKKVILPKSAFSKLPKTIGVFTTVQFIDSLTDINKQLEDAGIKVKNFKPQHAKYKGQILGCNITKFDDVDGFLFVGDGYFHPIALSIKNNLPVFTYNPFSKKLSELDKDIVKKFQLKNTIALKKYYMSDNIGVIVSTKHGQNKLKQALEFKKKQEEKGKKNVYILMFNDIDFESLENFPFIDCFVNTACARIGYDDEIRIHKPIINIEEIENLN